MKINSESLLNSCAMTGSSEVYCCTVFQCQYIYRVEYPQTWKWKVDETGCVSFDS